MTRSERKIEASRKRLEYKLKWLDNLRDKVKSGKTFKEACTEMADSTTKEITRNPQDKALIISAWAEFFKTFKEQADKRIAEQNGRPDHT